MAPKLPLTLNLRLSGMMFLQYAIWGAWLPILYPFLKGHRNFSGDEIGMMFSAGAVGAIFGPWVAGQFADRRFATEKFLAASHLAGGALVWFLATVADVWVFMGLSLVYGLIYAPTLALTNSLAFHHIPDRDRDFGKVRLWGTIGWIVVGIAMGHWLAQRHTPSDAELAPNVQRIVGELGSGEWGRRGVAIIELNFTGSAEIQTPEAAAVKEGAALDVWVKRRLIAAAQDAGRADAFRLSAILGALMALYCLTLPHTPPTKEAKEKSATFAAIGQIRKQPLLTLFLLAIPVSMIHQFYFVHTSQFLSDVQARVAEAQSAADSINQVLGVGGGGLMTIGQMTEIGVLFAIPLIAKRVSRKFLLSVGLVAYAARMALFAYTDSMWTIVAGVALHGFCFGCFIFVAFMVVDEETTKDVRASAQNLFNLVIVGIGIIVGSWFAVSIVASWAGGDYEKLFSVPMVMSVACLLILLVAYPKRATASP